MITEDYVSFEIAKLLKKKGFPQEYDRYHALVYNEEDYEAEYEVQRMILQTELIEAGTLSSYPIGVPEPKCYCPTLSLVMKWLREVHHVACFICPSMEQGFHTNKWNSYIDKLSDNFPKDPLWFVKTSDSYEEACEAAIKYCLENLI